jgi:hypothetical protein
MAIEVRRSAQTTAAEWRNYTIDHDSLEEADQTADQQRLTALTGVSAERKQPEGSAQNEECEDELCVNGLCTPLYRIQKRRQEA